MIVEIEPMLSDFNQVASLAGLDLHRADITHECRNCPHEAGNLPVDMQAVYVFSLPDPPYEVLKVGKVGPKSHARFTSHHYNPYSSISNLSKSLLGDTVFWQGINIPPPDSARIGDWIRQNVDRDNFFLPAQKGSYALALLEIFLQCRLHPAYEG